MGVASGADADADTFRRRRGAELFPLPRRPASSRRGTQTCPRIPSAKRLLCIILRAVCAPDDDSLLKYFHLSGVGAATILLQHDQSPGRRRRRNEPEDTEAGRLRLSGRKEPRRRFQQPRRTRKAPRKPTKKPHLLRGSDCASSRHPL